MPNIRQLSFNSSSPESTFPPRIALGLWVLISFLTLDGAHSSQPAVRIRGEVVKSQTLAESAGPTAAVFVIARRKDTRMPLAVQRLSNPKFPVKFDLGPEHVMTPGQKLDGEVFVEAKLTQRGDAISKPGDWIMADSPKRIDLKTDIRNLKLELAKKQAP